MPFPSIRAAVPIGLIWLSGVSLRVTILAVPPVLPMLRAELGLSGTEIGVLGSLPMVLFALAAVPGSLMVRWLGILITLVGGLAVVAAASALRGMGGGTSGLFIATAVMGLGIAVAQPAMPALIQRWLPQRVSFGTAVYTNGLLMGTILPVWLTLPLVLPLVGGDWRASLVAWSLPVAATVVLGLLVARSAKTVTPTSDRPRWWPDWRNGLYWRLGFLFGAGNGLYFATNTFIPDHLASIGHRELIGATLTAFNLGALPASLLLMRFAERIERRAAPYFAVGLLMVAGVAGLVSSASAWTIVWASVLGFCQGAALMLGLALPPLLSAPGDVARTTAAMFTISYTSAVVTAVVGGVAWDVSGAPVFAFAPIAFCGIVMVLFAAILRAKGELR